MKNKTKRTIKILCAVLLIVLLQVMGFTYAKYFTSDKATGSAEIAKWSFEIAKDGQQTKTINLADTVNKGTLVNGKIAPGTTGMVDIILDASGSEVDVEYELKFANEKNRPTNLHFMSGGEQYDSLTEAEPLKGIIKHNDATQQKKITFIWEWAFETGITDQEIEANDEIDTEEANKITEYTFDVIVTGTQDQ